MVSQGRRKRGEIQDYDRAGFRANSFLELIIGDTVETVWPIRGEEGREVGVSVNMTMQVYALGRAMLDPHVGPEPPAEESLVVDPERAVFAIIGDDGRPCVYDSFSELDLGMRFPDSFDDTPVTGGGNYVRFAPLPIVRVEEIGQPGLAAAA